MALLPLKDFVNAYLHRISVDLQGLNYYQAYPIPSKDATV